MAEAKATAKERGPVEELIAKRLRPLNKKIQRFRGYTSKPDSELNDDQRAALSSLPQLEAVARELEDLTKAVEEAELVAASKAREEREAALASLDARVAEQLAAFQLAAASRLGAFLKLHTLLHPSRPDDHDNLTFAPLTLPLRLQDEVLATDILRVGRMYSELTSGGDAGHAVLVQLSTGPQGEDDDDDRVHRLLDLLSSPELDDAIEVETEARSTAAEPPQSVMDDTSEFSVPSSQINGDDFDPQRTPLVSNVGLRAFDEPPPMVLGRGLALNFLQEDELAPGITEEAAFEVVEPESNAVSSRQSFTQDWADDEPERLAETLAEAARLGDSTPVSAEASGVASVAEPADAPAAEHNADVTVEDTVTLEAEKPAESSGAEGERRRKQPRKPSGRPRNGNQGGREGGNRGKKEDGEKKVDDDGFEIKTARRASGTARRGRGGPSGGDRGGARRPVGQRKDGKEGKDGHGDKGEEKKANGGGSGRRREGGREGGRKKEEGAVKEAKPKPSIYKTVQPGAPTSAPLL